MDEAGATRRAALDAVRDIEPAGLHDRISGWIDHASMVPGVVTIYAARTNVKQPVGEPDGLREALAERAAGVQLIYDGLRLTRTLSREEPWEHGDSDDGNLDILVADVLVARGFYLLARTVAAEKAVETVRAFGRDQTVGRETDDRSLDRNLEADALELAVIAGSDFGNGELPSTIREYATERATGLSEQSPAFPSAPEFFSESDLDWLRSLQTDSGGNGLTTSVDD